MSRFLVCSAGEVFFFFSLLSVQRATIGFSWIAVYSSYHGDNLSSDPLSIIQRKSQAALPSLSSLASFSPAEPLATHKTFTKRLVKKKRVDKEAGWYLESAASHQKALSHQGDSV